jgi:hypothetical protein
MPLLQRIHPRSVLMVILIPALFTLQCGSDTENQGNNSPCLLVAFSGCNAQLLAAGTYSFAVTSVGTTCFAPYEAEIKALFDGATIVLPSYADLPTHSTVTMTLPGVTVTANIVADGNLLQLTNITPNPVSEFGATVTTHCVYLCPVSATEVAVALDLTVNVPSLLDNCRDIVQVTGSLLL